MSDPFRDDERFSPEKELARPGNTYSANNSPTRYDSTPKRQSPSKTALRYSPAVSFGRRTEERYPIQQPRFDGVSERSKYTLLESPRRKKQEIIVIDEDEDLSDDPFSLRNSPSKYTPSRASRGSSDSGIQSVVLPPPRPIFSAQTYAAANTDTEYSEGGYRVSSDGTNSTFSGDLYEKDNFERTHSRDDDSTLYGKSDTSFSDVEDEDQAFRESLDGHMFYDLPLDHQPRRYKHTMTQKEFYLQNGNLILDNPVPSKLIQFLPRKDREFKYMRYSAVTSTPDEFEKSGFSLRANEYSRETELVICITMYNEDEKAFVRTMHGVMKNISYLCKRKKSRTWGEGSWEKIVVVIVSDGREKVSQGVLDVLSAMGVYQEGIAKSSVNKKDVTAHLFEYTAQISINDDLKFSGSDKGLVPVQICFCLKEENAKKINSHRWLFNAFCPVLNPTVCVLLDVGTKPDNHAIYHLWKLFNQDSNVAGAAGEITTMKGKYWTSLLNPLVASQNFEYKISNILDKPLESVFGYISVLPGALSAYRYTALKNHEDGTGPLASYFKGEFDTSKPESDIFTANMYLAEDRILCWELVAKRNEKWVLKYVKSATGETDVPDSLPEFISQRRRWLNGAFFAALYSQFNFTKIWKTDHSMTRKVFFHVEFFYQFIQLLFSFFSIGNFYLTFYYLAGTLMNLFKGGEVVFQILNYICLCDLVAMFMISMGNRPQGAKKMFLISLIILTICGVYALIAGVYFTANEINLRSINSENISNNVFASIIISMLSTYGLYTIMSILYLDPWHMITSALQYFIMLPGYTCLLQIYAFCNTHDVSWGTKGDNKQHSSLGNVVIRKDASGKDVADIEIIGEQKDIDKAFDDVLLNLRSRRSNSDSEEKKKQLSQTGVSNEDYFRDIRTRVVLVWLISNLILVMTVTQIYKPDSINSNKYLLFILISVAVLAAFRAIGSLAYLVHISIRFLVQSRGKFQLRQTKKNLFGPK